MSATWVCPEIGTDFTQDFEDLIIQYFYDKWQETDPAKGSTMKPDYESEPNTLSFKPAFPDYFRPYEICCVQTRTELIQQFNKGRFVFTTGLDVMLRMKRLDRDAIEVDPQLDKMEIEVERIVTRYRDCDIPGIKDLSFDPVTSVERVYNGSDSYMKSDWRSIVRIKAFYEKQNLT